jgi:hypothetical protein
MRWALLLLVPTMLDASVAKRPSVIRESPCEILEFGNYEQIGGEQRFEDTSSITGEYFELDEVKFVKTTSVVVAKVGEKFGIRYKLHLPPNKTAQVKWKITYPKAIEKHTSWDRTITADGGDSVRALLYEFVYDFEAVAGDWKFQVSVDNGPGCSFTFRAK